MLRDLEMMGSHATDSRWLDFSFGHCPGPSQDIACTNSPRSQNGLLGAFGIARLYRVALSFSHPHLQAEYY